MMRNEPLKFTPEVVLFPLMMVLALWMVLWVEVRFGIRFVRWGIYPMKVEGLKGILFGPFVHSGLKHLFNNSVPLFVLMMSLFYFYRKIRWKVLILGTLLTGIATWVIARPAWHIGASGVVYMLAAFLFFKGIFSRHFRLIALSLIVVFLYGGMLWYLFPIDPKISWEGHLSGFFIGLVLSVVYWKNPIQDRKYEWEKEEYDPDKDPFLKHFDEDGNFIEHMEVENNEPQDVVQPKSRPVRIVYQYRAKGTQEEE